MNLINLHSMISSVRQGELTTVEEIRDCINKAKSELDDTEVKMIKALEIRASCNHEFGKPTFTVQRRLIGYVTVYERVCKNCRYEESSTDDKPEWAEGATKAYYNNFI